MEASGQLNAPAASPPRKEPPGTHWIGGWVGPRAVLDVVVKRKIPSLRRESNPRTPIVQPLASMDMFQYRKSLYIETNMANVKRGAEIDDTLIRKQVDSRLIKMLRNIGIH
jgi:hypothetical protein